MPRTTNSKYQPSAPSNTMTYVLGGIAVLVIAGLVIGGFDDERGYLLVRD